MIALVTDSASHITPPLRASFGVTVVAITVTIDGEPHLEDSLSCDAFYARLQAGAAVTTAAPSPGQFLEAYEEAAKRGATGVVSVHVGEAFSGTLNSVNVAAGMSPIPVEVVDSGTANFGITCCIEAAARSVSAGGSLSDAAAAARAATTRMVNTILIGSPSLVRASGRVFATMADDHPDGQFRPWGVTSTELVELAPGSTTEALAETMADFVVSRIDARPAFGGVGHAAHPAGADYLTGLLRSRIPGLDPILHEIPPSVGAHLGTGSFGCAFSCLA